mgnify:CR=1 FL=1
MKYLITESRIKELIFKKLYQDLSNAEIIPYEGSLWFVDRENKYWYLEYVKSGDLWWRYDFFNNFFHLISPYSVFFIKYGLDPEDIEEKQLPTEKRSGMGLIEKLEFVLANDFARISYTEAIDILLNSNHYKKKKFQYIIDKWGIDLQSEHERYLVEKHLNFIR